MMTLLITILKVAAL